MSEHPTPEEQIEQLQAELRAARHDMRSWRDRARLSEVKVEKLKDLLTDERWEPYQGGLSVYTFHDLYGVLDATDPNRVRDLVDKILDDARSSLLYSQVRTPVAGGCV